MGGGRLCSLGAEQVQLKPSASSHDRGKNRLVVSKLMTVNEQQMTSGQKVCCFRVVEFGIGECF